MLYLIQIWGLRVFFVLVKRRKSYGFTSSFPEVSIFSFFTLKETGKGKFKYGVKKTEEEIWFIPLTRGINSKLSQKHG